MASASGSLGAILFYPIDLVKTRLQSSAGARFTGGVDCAAQLVATEGPLGLFSGVGVQVAGIAPQECVKLVVNDAVRSAWLGASSSIPLAGELLAGASAGLCQVGVTNPLEATKVRPPHLALALPNNPASYPRRPNPRVTERECARAW